MTAGASAPSTETSSVPDAGQPSSTASEAVDSVQPDIAVPSATLVMTFAEYTADTGSIDAAAFVNGLVESGGTCVLSATRSGQTTQTSPEVTAEAGAATTDCGGLRLDVTAAGAGTWSVSARYESGTTTLTSAPVEVQVP